MSLHAFSLFFDAVGIAAISVISAVTPPYGSFGMNVTASPPLISNALQTVAKLE